jgi:hypothetical protein
MRVDIFFDGTMITSGDAELDGDNVTVKMGDTADAAWRTDHVNLLGHCELRFADGSRRDARLVSPGQVPNTHWFELL